MTKYYILSQIADKVEKFTSLPEYIQRENASTIQFLRDQYRSIRVNNVVDRNSCWHPQALFEFVDERDFSSVSAYFKHKSESYVNIIGIKDMSVLDSKNNIYIKI